jgi:hypothetical protein
MSHKVFCIAAVAVIVLIAATAVAAGKSYRRHSWQRVCFAPLTGASLPSSFLCTDLPEEDGVGYVLAELVDAPRSAKPRAQNKRVAPTRGTKQTKRKTIKKPKFLPGQYCPVSFGNKNKNQRARKPVNKPQKKSVRRASNARPRGKKARKTGALIEMNAEGDGVGSANVPPLTPQQIAYCEQQRLAAQGGGSGSSGSGSGSGSSSGSASTTPKGQGAGGQKYRSLVNAKPNTAIWNTTISDRVKNCLADYNAQKVLPNGLKYGASVRRVSLAGKSAAQIESALRPFRCQKVNDVLKDPKTNQPVPDPRSTTGGMVPMLTYICPDGGAIRVKPTGDPTSKFRPQPQASKALRWPYDGPYVTFADETIKVNNRGSPIPKSVPDLGKISNNPADQSDAIEAWANDAHSDIKGN